MFPFHSTAVLFSFQQDLDPCTPHHCPPPTHTHMHTCTCTCVWTHTTATLTKLEQTLRAHRCFFFPGPPNLVLSRQYVHFPQSSLRHPGHAPQPRPLFFGRSAVSFPSPVPTPVLTRFGLNNSGGFGIRLLARFLGVVRDLCSFSLVVFAG